MRQIYLSLTLVLSVILLCFVGAYPPEKKLKLGKDLSGGVSLTYSVGIGPNENAAEVLAATIDVLKQRLDPDGVREISIVAQGDDRIEITMPLPGPRVKELREDFEQELRRLGRTALTENRLEQLMRAQGQERDTLLVQAAGGIPARETALRAAAAAFDEAAQARTAYEALTDAAAREAAAPGVAEKELAYESARKAVLATVLTADEVRRIVEASSERRSIMDDKERIVLPSQRERAEREVRRLHPESGEEIDAILAKYRAYEAQRTSFDDPQDVVRLIRGAGVLSFRIMVNRGEHAEEDRLRRELQELGPRNVRSTDARWFRVNQIESWINNKAEAEALLESENPVEAARAFFAQRQFVGEFYGGQFYLLAWDTRQARLTQDEGAWEVARARQGADRVGRAAIDFEMNPRGSRLLGALTQAHVGKQMAILLDDQIYTAPTLQSAISDRGQITGEFSADEIRYIVRVLSGGALRSKLSADPISINAVGPDLGLDNLRRGLVCAIVSVVVVAGFMIVYYFPGAGGIAVVALFLNALMIVGAMGLNQAAFTMPGIAGLILTFGMAVDSNVLIYERMREETLRGADMRTVVRLGFDRAASAIVDGNVTNLIVCVVLYYLGTPEIKGFALTMGIGVVANLYAALIVSRLCFNLAVVAGWKKVGMLPLAVPALQRAITPNFDWMKYRYAFFTVSAVLVTLGLVAAVVRGPRLFDNEFRGGTQVTLKFRSETAGAGAPMQLSRAQVEERVVAIGAAAGGGSQLAYLASAEVIPINPGPDGVTSSQFQIKTLADDAAVVLPAITEAFADVLETKPPLRFEGSEESSPRQAPVFALEKPRLGDNLVFAPGTSVQASNVLDPVGPYIAGAAIVLQNLDPAPTLESLRTRLETTREKAEYSATLGRQRTILVIEGTDAAVRTAVILVRDEQASVFENESRWEADVKAREWALVREALTEASTPASVHNFGPTVAAQFRANGIAATLLSIVGIGLYIWVRFKTIRYSLAAVVALFHDVLAVVGLIALSEMLYESQATGDFARSILLLPFKIDMNMLAALLTIAGYSLNDTVVIMDRIRENRGKLPYASRKVINDSINQTFSRTLITGGTTLLSCMVLYIWGGEGMRAFAFALFTGLLVGTYSSVAVAAPIVWSRREDREGGAGAPAGGTALAPSSVSGGTAPA